MIDGIDIELRGEVLRGGDSQSKPNKDADDDYDDDNTHSIRDGKYYVYVLGECMCDRACINCKSIKMLCMLFKMEK